MTTQGLGTVSQQTVSNHVVIPVLLVLQQLAVPAGQRVAGLTVKLQWLLLVDGTENGPLTWCADRLCGDRREGTSDFQQNCKFNIQSTFFEKGKISNKIGVSTWALRMNFLFKNYSNYYKNT